MTILFCMQIWCPDGKIQVNSNAKYRTKRYNIIGNLKPRFATDCLLT